ncbi:hypothetical protein CGLO_13940 [Colletotrichum gloeosporioides Cg-14]|uniref:Uncharacterized protein n=1 Tax=Colletotrichum gloeosporioides (strain Cg-14) TaxID=1237896 RepID=T0JVD8_COLGC|nr:hypothetical protein CGLO_13940 [Colletotrichum gloeosporioides Cg-14]
MEQTVDKPLQQNCFKESR